MDGKMVCPTTRGRADYTTQSTEMQAYIHKENKKAPFSGR
jgi:hypothetical protein